MSKRDKHVHRYKRVNLGKNGYKVYRCMLPTCTHYIRMELAEGKLCECNRCGLPMVLDKIAMQLAKPHCKDCTRVKRQSSLDRLRKLIAASELGP